MSNIRANPSVIRDCCVSVVGGAGFLGSHLVNYLIDDRKCKVVVVDNFCAGRKEFLHKDVILYRSDITGAEDDLYALFKRYKVRFVMNFAALPYVPDCYAHPLRTFNVNAFGAMKVINAAQEAGCEGVLQVSSAELYGNGPHPHYGSVGEANPYCLHKLTEDSIVLPHSSYGASKAAVDYYCQCAWKERKTPVISLRQFNCVGERETHPYVVPEIISQLFNPIGNGCPLLLGNNSTRDFLYAGDAVRMATELLEKGRFGEVYNLGSEVGIPIYDLAQKLSDIVGCGRITIEQDPSRVRPWEIWSLTSSNDKIYSVIESRPTVSLDEALRRTVSYYEANGRRWCWE